MGYWEKTAGQGFTHIFLMHDRIRVPLGKLFPRYVTARVNQLIRISLILKVSAA